MRAHAAGAAELLMLLLGAGAVHNTPQYCRRAPWLFRGRGGQGVAGSCCVGLGKGHVNADVRRGCFEGVGGKV
jgi:hypothetical protein